MKKSTILFIISYFFSHAGFSYNYVWQDYDDFSSSSLDTIKWEIGYWDGAQAPNIENGKAHLYGTGVGVGSIVPPSSDELVGMPQNGTNQSFLILKDDLIRGVEAEISLDSTFSGIYLGIMEAVEGGYAYAGIELNSWKQSGPSLEFSNTIYENGTETLESTLGDKPANLGQSYKVSVVRGESAYQLFLDSELIGEYPVRGELLFFSFGGYHDEDLPWDGYIDNVRVITDWEDYEDFSGSNIDTGRWSMGHWDGGNLPVVENERLTLTGNTISGFNEVLPTAGMLEFNPDIQPLLEEGFSSSNGTESHSILELIKDDILGIEVEVQLPTDAPSSVAIGLYASDWAKAFSEDQTDKSFFGLDLWRDHIDIEYVDPNTGEFISSELSTTAGSSHTFAFIFEDGKVFMFVDGGKVAEFSSANFSRDSIVIRAWNNAGEPFSAYAQNVRIVRNWEEYDDFSTGSLDSSKWDVSYYAGGKPPVINDGVLELSGTSQEDFNETYLDDSFIDEFPNAESDLGDSDAHSNVGINENLDAIEFEVMMPSSVPEKVGMGLYILDTSTFEDSFDYEARANATRAYADIWYESGYPQIEFRVSDHSTVYIPCSFDTYYRIGVVFEESKTSFYLNGEKKAEFEETFTKDYFLIRGTSSESVPFTAYMDNVRILRRSQDTPEPEPTPVTILSDPSGKPVVVQVGEEYQWNSTLDGVTLWALGVDEDGISKKGTAKFENGNKLIIFDMVDAVNGNENYNHPYTVDENGYIRVTESVYQYYNVVGVEDGAIQIIQDSNGLESVADNGSNPVSMLYFTTRAAAEEYYYAKVNPKNWMWFDHYPWVYSQEEQGWLYFYPSGGKLLYWSNQGKAWREFNQ
jgi:hypothetical protein